MADGLSLINEINALSEKLTNSIRLMAQYGREYAAAERDYKIALKQEALKLRDGGMAVTLIDKVAYGSVANERFNRDVTKVMYETAMENVNAIKLQIRILDNQIAREWGRGD